MNGLRERVASERSRAGFTLTETLAALAIMLLASTIVAAGVPAATKAYVAAVDNSNAQVLLSTTTTRLRDELSVADPNASALVQANAVTDESTGEMLYVTFDSAETGYATSVKYNDALGLFLEQTDAAGQVVQTPLVPVSAAAGANASLRAKADSIEWNADAGVFTVRGLKVVRGDDVLEHAGIDEFDVRVLALAS